MFDEGQGDIEMKLYFAKKPNHTNINGIYYPDSVLRPAVIKLNEEFKDSHLWNKSKLILLVYYLYLKEIQYRIDYKIDYVKLFTPPEQDIKIIKHDYEVIVRKIREGKAHELSEGDTLYLGAATKAASSADRRKQPPSSCSYSRQVHPCRARPRAACESVVPRPSRIW